VKKQVPLWPVFVVALLIAGLVAYFVLVRPKRAEAGRLGDQIAQLETEVQAAKLASRPSEATKKIKVADLFQLTKAMPDRDDMPGIMLQINSVASATGVTFKIIAPQDFVAGEGYRILPISMTYEGNYYDLTDFLFRLRNLVSVEDGKLTSQGRLFTLDRLDLHEDPVRKFPHIEAILVVSAYVYDQNSHAALTTPAPVAPPTDTTGTATSPVGAQAAGGLG
jgi:type IV pilus assembly protein PilO